MFAHLRAAVVKKTPAKKGNAYVLAGVTEDPWETFVHVVPAAAADGVELLANAGCECVVGCFVDLDAQLMTWTLNGKHFDDVGCDVERSSKTGRNVAKKESARLTPRRFRGLEDFDATRDGLYPVARCERLLPLSNLQLAYNLLTTCLQLVYNLITNYLQLNSNLITTCS
jgi:hypothetical protein